MGRPKSNTKSKPTQSCAETAQSRRINHARKTITRKDNEINNDDDISDENDESFLRNLSKDQQNPLRGRQEQERDLQQNPLRGHQEQERDLQQNPLCGRQEQERDLQQNPLRGHQEQERDLQQNPLRGRQEQERDLQQNPLCGRQEQERDLQQNPLRGRQDEIENRERVKRRRNERGKDDDDDDNYSVPPQFESMTNQLQICNWLVKNPAILQLATQMLNMKDTSQLAPAVHASSASSASSEHVNHEKYRLIDEEIKCLFLRSRFPPYHLFEKLVRKVFPELEAYSSTARSIVDRCRRSFSDYRYQLRVSIEELVREFQSKSERRGTTVSEVEINDFISRDVVIKRIFNRYFTAVDVSEIPEITMNKLIEFSKECFNIAWEGRDETNTRVFYDQIKTLDKNTEVLEIPSRSGRNFASSLKF
ncbi:hypothetical protein RclHR1_01190025 [Rhizophagus clarus]|uniref:Uncharacterized protein n=1 Tax=Rhizophagus clarus TaxID=94130 RepID=A0A2Z6QHV3_9GLOM|nr:hypothetical protein RclHR1_01190025 [Rhizophagus clarus]